MEAEAAKQAAVRSTIVFMGRKCKRPAGRASSYTSVLMVRHSSAAKSALGSQNGGAAIPCWSKPLVKPRVGAARALPSVAGFIKSPRIAPSFCWEAELRKHINATTGRSFEAMS
jgi:hypothetical protein